MKQRWLITVLVVTFAMAAVFVAGAANKYPQEYLIKDVRDSELIVEGVVTAVGSSQVPADQVFAHKSASESFPVTTIEVSIDNVLKGKWDIKTVTAVLTGNPDLGTFHAGVSYDYEPGESVVLCLHFDPNMMGGVYRLYGDAGSFVKRGTKWTTRGRQSEELTMTDMNRELAAAAPGSMVTAADAVVLGSVEQVDRKEFDCGCPLTCIADYVTVRVLQSWKGPENGVSILVRALRRGTNLPWYAPVPLMNEGEPYLMFLKRDSVGFYPFIGFNGFLKVDGDELIMNGHVQHPMSRAKMFAAIQQEVSR